MCQLVICERFLVKIWCGRNWIYHIISYILGLGNFHTSRSLDFLSNAKLHMKVIALFASYLSSIDKGDLLVNQMLIFLYNLSHLHRAIARVQHLRKTHVTINNDYAIVILSDNNLIFFLQFLLIQSLTTILSAEGIESLLS